MSALLIVIALAVAVYFGQRALFKAEAKRMLNEFVAKWPDLCPVCSFTRSAKYNGVFLDPPGPHPCPEGNERKRGGRYHNGPIRRV